MRSRSPFGVVVTALLAALFVGSTPFAQATKTTGAATPQEAVAMVKKATAANDFLVALPVFSPRGLKQLANEGITGVLMVLAFSDPDDAFPGSAKPSKAELDVQRKKYKDALDIATQTLKPYGLDGVIGKPAMAPETQKMIDAGLDKTDNVAFVTSLFGAMMKMGPLLGMSPDAKPRPLVEFGNVTGYKITGDKATAQNGAETMDFVRINGRWYLEPPASKNGMGSSAASSASTAGPGRQSGPAPKATAAGTQPEIVVGGIQIAKVVVSDDDFSAKPFHSDNGTKIILWVKMPTGQGLIELDEDASLLQHFGDDKGTDFGGKFGSFPEEFQDGTGGIIEIESSGIPSATATSLVAEGTLTMSVATGTRKIRVPNVRLVNDTKFMFGTTSITMSSVETDGDEQKFTLKLPRQIMTGIKNVVFLDAKGQVVEGRSSGGGYMGDAGEMNFTVKTALKALTIEFEAWQGLKTIKVPFKVKAGLGMS